jgi:hypothetical protein
MKRLFLNTIGVLSLVFFSSSTFALVEGMDILTGKSKVIESGEKGMVLVFLSARCPCSDSHTKLLNQISKKYSQFTFVGVHSNADEDLEMAKEYFGGRKMEFTVLHDSDFKLVERFKAVKTPHAFVLNKAEEVLYRGGVTDSSQAQKSKRNYLTQALDEINSGLPVSNKSGRALGCAIARK